MAVASAILIVVITILCEFSTSIHLVCPRRNANRFSLVPPFGVWAVAGCGMGMYLFCPLSSQ